MKSLVMRFSSVFLALTMTLSITLSACSSKTNKTETTATETTAPTETETTATSTAAPTEPSQTSPQPEVAGSQLPMNCPAQTSGKINVELDPSTGIMKWTRPEYDHDDVYAFPASILYINGADVFIDEEDKDGKTLEVLTLDLKKEIDDLIKTKEIEKAKDNTYVIWLFMEDVEGVEMYATWKGTFIYESNVKAGSIGSIKAGIKDGVLTWKSYKGASSYVLYINEFNCERFSGRKLNINKEIDWLIKSGYIDRSGTNTYKLRLVGYNDDKEKNVAGWNYEYKYESSAQPFTTPASITGIDIENGVLKWDAVEGATTYRIDVYVDSKPLDHDFSETNKMDVNKYIKNLIKNAKEYGGVPTDGSKYSFTVRALSYHYANNEGDFPIELANGSYDNYVLKSE